jgi:hypothetical protein
LWFVVLHTNGWFSSSALAIFRAYTSRTIRLSEKA